MQHRMKTHPLTQQQIHQLLTQAQVGCLATLNQGGSPYVTPVHFVFDGECVYVHGLPKGQRLDNLRADPRVSMTVFHMEGLLLDPEGKPCDTNTQYQSVILSGRAVLLEDIQEKERVLSQFVAKYTPHLVQNPLPAAMVRGTAVTQITVEDITGKYYT